MSKWAVGTTVDPALFANLSVARGKQICVTCPVALRFEKRRVLDWVAYHELIGVDCFILFLDPDAYMENDPEQRLAYQALLGAPNVKLYMANGKERLDSMGHFELPYSLMKGLEVMPSAVRPRFAAYIDVDEFLVLRDAPEHSIRGALTRMLNSFHGRGLYLHRWHYGTNGYDSPPSLKDVPEFGLMTSRRGREALGKLILRLGVGAQLDTMHLLKAPARLQLPDGSGFYAGPSFGAVVGGEKTPRLKRLLMTRQPLSINHYSSGSLKECIHKSNHTGLAGLRGFYKGYRAPSTCFHDHIRVVEAPGQTQHTGQREGSPSNSFVADAALAKYAKATRDNYQRVFGEDRAAVGALARGSFVAENIADFVARGHATAPATSTTAGSGDRSLSPRVFFIGAGSTGTHTLSSIMLRLMPLAGVCHEKCKWNDKPGASKQYVTESEVMRWIPDWSRASESSSWVAASNRHDAAWFTRPGAPRVFMDGGEAADWRFLESAFPDSRWVLQTRPLLPWVTSALGRRCRGAYTYGSRGRLALGPECVDRMRAAVAGLAAHQRGVLEYFGGSHARWQSFATVDLAEDGERCVTDVLRWVTRPSISKDTVSSVRGSGPDASTICAAAAAARPWQNGSGVKLGAVDHNVNERATAEQTLAPCPMAWWQDRLAIRCGDQLSALVNSTKGTTSAMIAVGVSRVRQRQAASRRQASLERSAASYPRPLFDRQNHATVLQIYITSAPTPWWRRDIFNANRRYAEEQLYHYVMHTSMHASMKGLAAPWHRIPYMMDAFNTGTPLVGYLDADVRVINCSVRLELLMAEECRAAELAVSMDNRPIPVGADKTYLHCCLGTCFCLINTGIILARNTPWTNAFLQRVVNNSRCAPYYSERQWEQDCMQLVLQEMGELSTELVQQQGVWGDRTVLSTSGRVCFLPAKVISPWKVEELISSHNKGWAPIDTRSEPKALPLAVHLVDVTRICKNCGSTVGKLTKLLDDQAIMRQSLSTCARQSSHTPGMAITGAISEARADGAASASATKIIQVWMDLSHPERRLPEYIRHSLSRNAEYALEQGYSYSFESKARPDARHRGLHPAWQRFFFLLDTLSSGVEIAAYFDTDVQIINRAIRIEQLVSRCGDRAQLILASGQSLRGLGCCLQTSRPCPCFINTGVTILRNRPWVKNAVQHMLGDQRCANYHQNRQWEQDCLQLWLNASGELPIEHISSFMGMRSDMGNPRSPARALSQSGRVCVLDGRVIAPWRVEYVKRQLPGEPSFSVHLLDEASWQPSWTTERKSDELRHIEGLLYTGRAAGENATNAERPRLTPQRKMAAHPRGRGQRWPSSAHRVSG